MIALLKKLGTGFIYGVGFAIGVAGIAALAVVGGASYLSSTSGRSIYFPESASGKPLSTSAQFVVSDTRAVKNDWGRINILGTVHNTGEDVRPFVTVYADLIDNKGKFIYQCTHQFTDGLRKDERANFMITCHGIPPEVASTYDTQKVYARAR